VSTTLPTAARSVDVIGVPMDLGASRRGVDMGPSAIRYAKLHEKLRGSGITTINDHGNLQVPIREALETGNTRAKYYDVIAEVCDRLADLVVCPGLSRPQRRRGRGGLP